VWCHLDSMFGLEDWRRYWYFARSRNYLVCGESDAPEAGEQRVPAWVL
jgi:hypothetical protein